MTLRGRNLPPPKNRRQLAIALAAINDQIVRGVRPRVNAPTPVTPAQAPNYTSTGASQTVYPGAINGSTSGTTSNGQGGAESIGGVSGIGGVGGIGGF